jgi:hypothetical protein
MPHYHSSGNIPHKRHTQFRKPDGGLYSEQLFSTEGFSNDYSLLYHIHPPTVIIKSDAPIDVSPVVAEDRMLQHRCFDGFNLEPVSDYLFSRMPILVNNDVNLSLAAPQGGTAGYFVKNADADEVIFIHEGSGVLMTQYGNIEFGYGDYLVIPRGCIYQVRFKDENNRLFIIESFSPVSPPKKYLSKYGQLLEQSPYCERDLRKPSNLQTFDETGDFLIKTKKRGMMYGIHYGHHPFDVVGWDGCCYPYALSIHDFEPIQSKEINAQRLPTLSLNAGANLNNTNNSAGQLLRNTNYGPVAGVSLAIPIYSAGLVKQQLRVNKVQQKTQQVFYDQLKNDLQTSLANAYNSSDNALKKYELAVKTLEVVKENNFIAMERFRKGSITTVELRQTQLNYIETQTRLINSMYQLKQAQADILLIMGRLVQ